MNDLDSMKFMGSNHVGTDKKEVDRWTLSLIAAWLSLLTLPLFLLATLNEDSLDAHPSFADSAAMPIHVSIV